MDNMMTRKIAFEMRSKFVSCITTSVNSLYYKNNITDAPATGDDIPAPMFLTMEDLGIKFGDVVIPARDPNYVDDRVVGVYVIEKDGGIVVDAVAVEGYDMSMEELNGDMLCALSFQFEYQNMNIYGRL